MNIQNMCQSIWKQRTALLIFAPCWSWYRVSDCCSQFLWCLFFLYIYKALDKFNVKKRYVLIKSLWSSSSTFVHFTECGVFISHFICYDLIFLLFQLQCLVKNFKALSYFFFSQFHFTFISLFWNFFLTTKKNDDSSRVRMCFRGVFLLHFWFYPSCLPSMVLVINLGYL